MKELPTRIDSDGNVVALYTPKIVGLYLRAAHALAFTGDNDFEPQISVSGRVQTYPSAQEKKAQDEEDTERLKAATEPIRQHLVGIQYAIVAIAVVLVILHFLG